MIFINCNIFSKEHQNDMKSVNMPWGMFEDLRCTAWKRGDLSGRATGVCAVVGTVILETRADLFRVATVQN